MNDPFEHLDLQAELDPANWRETDWLHTPTLDAYLVEGRLFLRFQDGSRKQFSRSEVEALTRFLQQYAKVEPLTVPEDLFADLTPKRVIGPDGPEENAE